jgi:ELWxxDGT repeat protein
VNGTLFFQAGGTLWKSDGTEAGTVAPRALGVPEGGPFNPHYLTNVAGTVFFIAQGTTPNNGWELWKSDGTAAGTVEVKDIVPGSGSAFADSNFSTQSGSQPMLTAVGSTLYFVATGTTSTMVGRELWKSDGTAAGTVMVKDIRPGVFGAFDAPNNGLPMANVGGTLYFGANDGVNGAELWKSDGTAAGTVLVKDATPGFSSSFSTAFGTFPSVNRIVNVGDTLYLVIHGRLWKSDGTTAGTVMVSPAASPQVSSA